MDELVEKILKKVSASTKSWANTEEVTEDHVTLVTKDRDEWHIVINALAIEDGLESFSEACLKHEDAGFRKVAREISREQWGKIRLNKYIVSAIVQHGAFGEEIY